MKEGYKKTEVGVIPEDWEVKSINDIAYVNPESLKNSTDKGIEIKYIDIESVSTGKISCIKNYIFAEAPSRARRIVKKEDVIVSTVRPNLKAIANIKSDLANLVCSTGFAVLRNKKNISAKFLYQFTLSDIVTNQLVNKTVGSNYPAVNSTDIKETLIIVPPLKEQEKIADILSTIDCQIDDTEMLIEKCQELKTGLMQKLLTKGIGHKEFKKTEVGEIPVEWEVKNIGKCAEVTKLAGFEFTEYMEYKEEGEIIALRALNLKKGKLDLKDIKRIDKTVSENLQRSKLFKGNMLFSYVGTIGEVALIQEDNKYHLAPNVAKITFSNVIIPEFGVQYFTSIKLANEIKKYVTTTSQPALSMENIRKMKIVIPSIQEQVQIAQILSSIDYEIDEYENKKQKLEDLKKGVMQQLLTGNIRVLINH